MLVMILYCIAISIINLGSFSLLFISIFWTTYLLSELKRVYPLWKYQKRLFSQEGNIKSIYYRNILVKNSLALIFVITELITFSAETLEGIVREIILQVTLNTNTTSCHLTRETYLWWNVDFAVVRIIETVRQIGMLLLLAIMTVLVIHLHSVYAGTNRINGIKRVTTLTFVCLFVFLMMKSFSQTILLAEVVYMVALSTMFYSLVRQSRYLFTSLTRRVVDLYHEGPSLQKVYLREKGLAKMFKWTIVPIYTSAGIGIFGQLFYGVVYVGVGSLSMNSCWLDLQYNTQLTISYNGTLKDITDPLLTTSNFLYLSTGAVFLWTVIVVNVSMCVVAKYRAIYNRGSASLKTYLIDN